MYKMKRQTAKEKTVSTVIITVAAVNTIALIVCILANVYYQIRYKQYLIEQRQEERLSNYYANMTMKDYRIIKKYAPLLKCDNNVEIICALIEHETIGTWSDTITSPAGAVGKGQLMPATAKWLKCSDITDAEQNIKASITYLEFCRKKANDNIDLALMMYHAGHNRRKYINQSYAEAVKRHYYRTI